MFEDSLKSAQVQMQAEMDRVLATLPQGQITDAMAHATRGGKRLRGFLVLESARLCDVGPDRAMVPACAIEALHAYSLVHDDLPCMDDDDMRRGQPTVHKKWDEATAVLAGDALQTLAFDLVSQDSVGADPVRVRLVQTLAQASGMRGMVYGQALDIAAETAGTPLTLDEIETLQRHKTGALIEWSACAGPRLAQTDESAFANYAQALGLAFQIADDILDVTGDAATVGKATGKDADAGKATFVSLLGLDEAKRRATALVDFACDALHEHGEAASALQAAARFTIARNM